MRIDFQTNPSRYRHWRLDVDGPVATLTMDVDENAGLFDGYHLKLNSYDLGVDIELFDAIQRLRFEHPTVKAVVFKSGKDRVFCAGANIRMLAGAEHAHKVNFCKFTNETRNTMEASSTESGQTYIAAIKGACAGGGYELALAADELVLVDDSSSSVALPEVPLLAVLPGTGGLTRVTDKRKVRRDLADVFCTVEEGIKGKKAQDWKLVDEVVPATQFDARIAARAAAAAARSDRPDSAEGITLNALDRTFTDEGVRYSTVEVAIDRSIGNATLTVKAPTGAAPAAMDSFQAEGDQAWMLRCGRELDDAILHLRLNEVEVGILTFKTEGDPALLAAHEALILDNADSHWLAREVRNLWKRVLKRIDLTSRSLVALIEPGSCWSGVFAEIAFACDRSYMLDGQFEGDNRPAATLTVTGANFGPFPMSNGLSRLQTRFLDDEESLAKVADAKGEALDAEAADVLGLVTFAYDDIDWEDEIRIFFEERSSFSPDSMTGMEANLRFAGPETMETRIFGRLTAWQNWIFQRPNASGEDGALRRYGTGKRGNYDMRRV